jgi:hypothetical protein
MFLLLALFLSLSATAQSPNLVERVVEVKTEEKNPAVARPALMNAAAEKASEELIKEIIGEAKYSRNRSLIQSRILKRSASYLPFSKAGELKSLGEGAGFQMAVTVRANLDDLQRLLLENGLFYDTDSTPTVLPVIRWTDRVNSRNFGWWMAADPSKAFLSKESRLLENVFHETFLKSGFYLIRPQGLHYEDLLDGANGESPSSEETSSWAQAWNAQILLQGQVQLSKGERAESVAIDVRLSAVQVLNGRVVAEVARQFESDAGPFEMVADRKLKEVFDSMSSDLSAQLLEAWKQGTINSQLYRLKILGRLTLPAQEVFKDQIRNKVREIKSVRERLIEANQMVYEVDSSIPPTEIAKKLTELDIQGIQLAVDEASEKELVLKVKK